MTTTRRGAVFLSLFAAGALLLTACGSDGDSDAPGDPDAEDPGGSPGGDTVDQAITLGYESEMTSYNALTGEANGIWNHIVLNGVQSGYWHFSDEGVTRDETFATYEMTSEVPLTVEYTISDAAVWSDGEPIDCDDVLLDWAAYSGAFTQDGQNIFDAISTTGYDLIAMPECQPGDKQWTAAYAQPFADWETVINAPLPAHVAAEQAGLSVQDMVAAIQAGDTAALAPVAEFWNTGWVMDSGQLPDPSVIPSSGPYKIEAWEAGQSITLTANEDYWGEPPVSSTIVIRYLDQDQQAQALQNGEIDVMSPTPNVDLLSALEGLGDQVAIMTGDTSNWEHVDLQMGEGRIFADEAIREAFAKCIPRQLIVDNLIAPLYPEAVTMDIREFMPFDDEYQQAVDGAFPEERFPRDGDIAGAEALLQEAGYDGTPIRLMHSDTQLRTDIAALIQSSCAEAGLVVEPFADVDWGAKISGATGEYDAVLFAWSGSGIVSSGSALYMGPGDGSNANVYGYDNEEVDALWNQILTTIDVPRQVDMRIEMESLLWEDVFNIPLFAHPGVTATAANITGVVYNSTQSGVTWNMQDWGREG